MAEKRSGGRKQAGGRTEKRAGGDKQAPGRAEKRASTNKEATGRTGKRSEETTAGTQKRTAEHHDAEHRRTTAGKAQEPSSGAGRNGLSAADAVSRARGTLAELLGLPVEGVLGIDRDGGNWVATVQVLELARIPNTTDVLGEYETVLDGRGEVIRYHRTRRYHRGQVEGSQQ